MSDSVRRWEVRVWVFMTVLFVGLAVVAMPFGIAPIAHVYYGDVVWPRWVINHAYQIFLPGAMAVFVGFIGFLYALTKWEAAGRAEINQRLGIR